MAENPKPMTDRDIYQLTLIFIVTQIEHLTKTLKAYYDQHQATLEVPSCSSPRTASSQSRKYARERNSISPSRNFSAHIRWS
jgi:hypothetical protein